MPLDVFDRRADGDESGSQCTASATKNKLGHDRHTGSVKRSSTKGILIDISSRQRSAIRSRQTRYNLILISALLLWLLVLMYTSILIFQEQYVIGTP